MCIEYQGNYGLNPFALIKQLVGFVLQDYCKGEMALRFLDALWLRCVDSVGGILKAQGKPVLAE